MTLENNKDMETWGTRDTERKGCGGDGKGVGGTMWRHGGKEKKKRGHVRKAERNGEAFPCGSVTQSAQMAKGLNGLDVVNFINSKILSMIVQSMTNRDLYLRCETTETFSKPCLYLFYHTCIFSLLDTQSRSLTLVPGIYRPRAPS